MKRTIFFSDGDHEPVTKIKVMADYCACTWDHEGAGFNLESIGVPSVLIAKFSEWESWYGMNLEDNNEFDPTAFDKRGKELAMELKKFVGNNVMVSYFSEATLEEVEIEVQKTEIDFTMLGQDFFRCYFGDKSDVSVTELAKILGSHAIRNWGKMFQAWVEMRKAPHAKRRGRVRVTPGTLAVWFERESNRRS